MKITVVTITTEDEGVEYVFALPGVFTFERVEDTRIAAKEIFNNQPEILSVLCDLYGDFYFTEGKRAARVMAIGSTMSDIVEQSNAALKYFYAETFNQVEVCLTNNANMSAMKQDHPLIQFHTVDL